MGQCIKTNGDKSSGSINGYSHCFPGSQLLKGNVTKEMARERKANQDFLSSLHNINISEELQQF